MDQPATREAIATLLHQHSTLTLATRTADGSMMAASLFFASDAALHIYWVSGPHSRHSRNLEHASDAALTVHNATWNWTAIAGVQMAGNAAPVPPGSPWQAVWERYLVKFPFAHDFEGEIMRSNFYEFVPRWARLIDNARGFGFKAELIF